MGWSTIWNEIRIKFKIYAECRIWADIYKIYWDFCSVIIINFFLGKETIAEPILMAINGSSDVRYFDLYLQNKLLDKFIIS